MHTGVWWGVFVRKGVSQSHLDLPMAKPNLIGRLPLVPEIRKEEAGNGAILLQHQDQIKENKS